MKKEKLTNTLSQYSNLHTTWFSLYSNQITDINFSIAASIQYLVVACCTSEAVLYTCMQKLGHIFNGRQLPRSNKVALPLWIDWVAGNIDFSSHVYGEMGNSASRVDQISEFMRYSNFTIIFISIYCLNSFINSEQTTKYHLQINEIK